MGDHDNNHFVLAGISLGIMILAGVATYIYRGKLKHLKKYGLFGIFLLSIIGNIAPLSPASTIVAFIGGKIYHPLFVGFIVAVGSILGEILTYNVGSVGELAFHEKSWYPKIQEQMEKHGFLTIVAVTAIPNPLVNIAAVVAGTLDYPLWKFLIASFLGNFIQFSICAYLGYNVLTILHQFFKGKTRKSLTSFFAAKK
jgi:uncharacterized membrane protein YdjX (TVP38/TMEM64 family)